MDDFELEQEINYLIAAMCQEIEGPEMPKMIREMCNIYEENCEIVHRNCDLDLI